MNTINIIKAIKKLVPKKSFSPVLTALWIDFDRGMLICSDSYTLLEIKVDFLDSNTKGIAFINPRNIKNKEISRIEYRKNQGKVVINYCNTGEEETYHAAYDLIIPPYEKVFNENERGNIVENSEIKLSSNIIKGFQIGEMLNILTYDNFKKYYTHINKNIKYVIRKLAK